jgi:hypothetical protein
LAAAKKSERRKEVNCNHPANKRTDLSKGDGFRCEECKTVIKMVKPPDPVAQHFDITKLKSLDAGNGATVKTVPLTKNERERCNKDRDARRNEELRTVEGNAKRLAKIWKDAEKVGSEILQRRMTMAALYKEAHPLVDNVLDGFAHLRKGEQIMGHTTAAAWAKDTLGCTYERLRQLRNPKPDKLLLMDGNSAIDVTFKIVEPTTPAAVPTPASPKGPTVFDTKALATAKQEKEEEAQAEAGAPVAVNIVDEVMGVLRHGLRGLTEEARRDVLFELRDRIDDSLRLLGERSPAAMLPVAENADASMDAREAR